MGRYSVAMVYPGNPHTACFGDFVDGVKESLIALGHDVVPTNDARPGRFILFGGANPIPDGEIPADAIVYNAEQVRALDAAFLSRNFDQHRDRVVWDYSEVSAAVLREYGVKKVVLCPVGYAPSMTRIRSVENEDIDVLFYGSMNQRRREILDALRGAGVRVAHLFGAYGAERDKVIARAKVVLNLHFYHPAVFEIFRVSHLLANRRCVVSENGGVDRDLEDLATTATRLVSREQIVEACRELVADAAKRRAQAERGFEVFRKTSLVENVWLALEQS